MLNNYFDEGGIWYIIHPYAQFDFCTSRKAYIDTISANSV